jgi:hypothetical protein
MESNLNLSGHLNVKSGYNQIGDKRCFHLTKAKWNLSYISLGDKIINLESNKIG